MMFRSAMFLLSCVLSLTLAGCPQHWPCEDEDEVANLLDGRCVKRVEPEPDPADAGSIADGAVDPRVEAHGRACDHADECSPLAPVCSMRLGDLCPTEGCCISRDCDEDDPDSCPPNWTCLYISFSDATFCVPE